MFDESLTMHLHAGCALLIGTVSADGMPHASRGHGMRVLGDDPPRVRLVLPAHDERMLANLRATGRVAITTADVPTLHSVQLKGTTSAIEPATAEDEEAARRYAEQFVDDIERTDGFPRAVVATWAVVEAHLACVVVVDEIFDQSPGPAAGAARATVR